MDFHWYVVAETGAPPSPHDPSDEETISPDSTCPEIRGREIFCGTVAACLRVMVLSTSALAYSPTGPALALSVQDFGEAVSATTVTEFPETVQVAVVRELYEMLAPEASVVAEIANVSFWLTTWSVGLKVTVWVSPTTKDAGSM
jgi:hypothetical protein